MPIPLIAVGVVGAVSLVAAGATYFYWKDIKRKVRGKTMMVMGPRGCGKTTIGFLLENNRLPPEAIETKMNGTFKAKKFDFSDLNIIVNQVDDMPGNNEARKSKWKPHFEKCDFAMYVLRSDLFLQGDKDHISRVEKDVKDIKEWLVGSKKKVVFVATYSDQAPVQKISVSDAMAANSEFKRIAALISSNCRRGPAVGSLASVESAKDLIFHSLKEIEEIR